MLHGGVHFLRAEFFSLCEQLLHYAKKQSTRLLEIVSSTLRIFIQCKKIKSEIFQNTCENNYAVCLCSSVASATEIYAVDFFKSPLKIKSKREKYNFSPVWKVFAALFLVCDQMIDFSGKNKCDFSVRIWTSSCGFTHSSIMLFCYEEIHSAFTVLVICFVNDQK